MPTWSSVAEVAQTASDPLALPAFVLSLVALVVALASFVWKIVEWRMSGPQVRVKTHLLYRGDKLNVAAFVWNRGRAPVDILDAILQPHGYKKHSTALMLTVRGAEDEIGLPYRLEPGSSVVLETEVWPKGTDYGRKWYRSRVTLANGDIVKSRRERRAGVDHP